MRVPVLLVAAAVPSVMVPSTAHATCDGCCDVRATLAGWSEDARHWAVTYRHDSDEEQLVLHGDTERSWSAYADGEEPMCVEKTPRLPGRAGRDADRIDVRSWRALRHLHLVPPQADWRTSFDDEIDVVPVGHRRFAGDPFALGVKPEHACTAWEVRDRDGHTLATLPRQCEDALPIGSLVVVGGYLHPGGRVALVKVRIHRERLMSDEHYLRVELPGA